MTKKEFIKLPNPKKVRDKEFQELERIVHSAEQSHDFHQESTRCSLENLLALVTKETKLLTRHKIHSEAEGIRNALLNIAKTSDQWIRPIDTYRSRSHNVQRQLTNLLDHLYSKYPRPTFLDSAFLQTQQNEIRLFIHIVTGKNIRTFDSGSNRLTKVQAHHFHTTPKGYNITEARLRAQILSYGIEDRLIPSLISIPFGPGTQSLQLKYLEFLSNQPMMDPTQIHPLWDYVKAHRTTPTKDGKNNPFTFKGRTLAALLQKVDQWHGELRRAKANKNRNWAPSGTPGFQYPENPKEDQPYWTITEICGERELHTEGKELKHCVYSYTESCIQGNCTIWSLKQFNHQSQKFHRIATLEIQNNQIVQARKAYNESLQAPEKNIVAQWARQEKIRF